MILSKFLQIYQLLNKPTHCLRKSSGCANPQRLAKANLVRQNMSDSNLKPPDRVYGLTTLDRPLFEKTISVPCLTLKDTKPSTLMPLLKKFLLKMDNFKPVQNVSPTETRFYLNPDVVQSLDDLSLLHTEISLETHSITLCYDNFSWESILKAVLPSDMEGLSSFTKVGHIVHVNMREHLIPYKDVIGQVLFDKVANCRTVVNKAAIIDSTYRNFQMEVLSGEADFLVRLKENKCFFELDFSQVYWNSRLCTEHERIVNMIGTGSVVFDVFAGVGPFAVPLAKKKCQVFANDLNPEAYKWLNRNSKINKIDGNYFRSFNKDGKDFILEEIKEFLPQFLKTNKVFIIMNLPALAVEFLSYFVGLYQENELDEEVHEPPTVIVYCFAKGEDYVGISKNLLFENIGKNIEDKIIDIFKVRTVSSLKEMMRITFRLDRDLLVKKVKRKHQQDEDKTETKKCCHGEEQAEEN